MREKQLGRRSWQARATQLVLAGTLALSMVPGTALAVTVGAGGNSQANSQVLATGTDATNLVWADGAWVKDPKTVTNGVYQWKTTIKGDGSHYGHYDALVTFTVKNKVLTAVDLTSQGTTFGGQWGVITPKSTNVTGYLPKGVSVQAGAVQNATSGAVNVKLAGAENYGGYVVNAITLCKVTDDGKLETEEKQVWDEEDQHYDTVVEVKGYNVADSLTAASESASTESVTGRARPGAGPSLATTSSVDTSVVNWNHQDQTLTLTNPQSGDYNIAKVSYKIGDYFVFDQYIALDGTDGTGENYDVPATDLAMAPSGIGAKNRDVYTAAAYAVLLQRQLMSWQGVGGVKQNLDVVSAATKSSDSLIEAIYAAYGYSYPASNHDNPQELMAPAAWGQLFTSVADDVKLTIDAGKTSASTIWDQTSVTTNAAGDYVLTCNLSDALPVSGLQLFKSSSKLNSNQMWQLGASSASLAESFETKNTAEHGICGALDNAEVSSGNVTWNAATRQLTIKKNSGINYVAVGFGVGKLASNGICYVPYSLEEMAAATAVTTQIQKMSATDYNAVTAARAAYNALSPDARTFVGRAEVAKLNAANPAKPAATTTPVATTKTVAQKLTVSNNAKTIYYSSLSKGKLKKATSFTLKTTGNKGKVTYKVSSYSNAAAKKYKKYITVSSAGKVTVKKGLPMGTYTLKVKATAAKASAKSGSVTTTYPAASKTVTVTVTVGAQKASVTTKATAKASTLKKKKVALSLTAKTTSGKITKVANASTDKTAKKFTVKRASNKKITVTVPKGTKKGTYTLKVKVTAPKVAGKCLKTTVTKTVKITVK